MAGALTTLVLVISGVVWLISALGLFTSYVNHDNDHRSLHTLWCIFISSGAVCFSMVVVALAT